MIPKVIAFRNAVMAILESDPGLAELGPVKIYDRVPEKPVLPFIGLGPMKHGRTEAGVELRPVTLRLYTASTRYDRVEAWQMAEAVEQALDGAVPELAAPWAIAVELRVESGADIIAAGDPKQVFLDVSATLQRLA